MKKSSNTHLAKAWIPRLVLFLGLSFVFQCDPWLPTDSLQGVVTTLAGSLAVQGQGALDGTGSAARFTHPEGPVFTEGVLYVSDFYSIRVVR